MHSGVACVVLQWEEKGIPSTQDLWLPLLVCHEIIVISIKRHTQGLGIRKSDGCPQLLFLEGQQWVHGGLFLVARLFFRSIPGCLPHSASSVILRG